MVDEVKGDGNIVAGGDVTITRPDTYRNNETVANLFKVTDKIFRESVSPEGQIRKQNTLIDFSSESLFSSLITIGIPVNIAIDVPSMIIPLLKTLVDDADEHFELTSNHVRSAVLQVLSGLQFLEQFQVEQVTTWCSAYVRRYGSSVNFLKVIDGDNEVELDYQYMKEIFLPHVLQEILGLEKGQDPVIIFHDFFQPKVIERMANEVMRSVNTLNVYSLHYKTLFYLVNDIMLQPPHPWIVNRATTEKVLLYNLERATYHYSSLGSETAQNNPILFMPTARECIVHLCAAILSHYGCLLGVESRYGLRELIRVINLKIKERNLPMWDYCSINNLEADLKKTDMTLQSFNSFLKRIGTSLEPTAVNADGFKRAVKYCGLLIKYTEQIIDRRFFSESEKENPS